jgi:hypothetical protein
MDGAFHACFLRDVSWSGNGCVVKVWPRIGARLRRLCREDETGMIPAVPDTLAPGRFQKPKSGSPVSVSRPAMAEITLISRLQSASK